MPNHCTNYIKIKGDRKVLEKIYEKHCSGNIIDFDTIIPSPDNLIRCGINADITKAVSYIIDRYGGNMGKGIYNFILDEGLDFLHGKMPDDENLKMKLKALTKHVEHDHPDIEFEKYKHIYHLAKLFDESKMELLPTWYTWNISNWGTKWNAYYVTTCELVDDITILFDTAWSVPEQIIAKLYELYGDKVDIITKSVELGCGILARSYNGCMDFDDPHTTDLYEIADIVKEYDCIYPINAEFVHSTGHIVLNDNTALKLPENILEVNNDTCFISGVEEFSNADSFKEKAINELRYHKEEDILNAGMLDGLSSEGIFPIARNRHNRNIEPITREDSEFKPKVIRRVKDLTKLIKL